MAEVESKLIEVPDTKTALGRIVHGIIRLFQRPSNLDWSKKEQEKLVDHLLENWPDE